MNDAGGGRSSRRIITAGFTITCGGGGLVAEVHGIVEAGPYMRHCLHRWLRGLTDSCSRAGMLWWRCPVLHRCRSGTDWHLAELGSAAEDKRLVTAGPA